MKGVLIFLLGFISTVALRGQDTDTASQRNTITLSDSVIFSDSTYNGNTSTPANQADKHTLIEPDSLHDLKLYQAQKIEVRKFDEARWKEIVGGKNYNEKQEAKPAPTARVPWGGVLVKLFSYAVIVVIVLLMAYYVLKNIKSVKKVKKKMMPSEEFAAAIENIEDLDLKELLRQALLHGNLRTAVRIYYLGLLRKLNENGMIVWKKDKTNRDYLVELVSQAGFFEEVRLLTIAYEQVWYGEHPITQASYQKLIEQFEIVEHRITTSPQ